MGVPVCRSACVWECLCAGVPVWECLCGEVPVCFHDIFFPTGAAVFEESVQSSSPCADTQAPDVRADDGVPQQDVFVSQGHQTRYKVVGT